MFCPSAVADPGFSPGGAPTPKIAIIFHIFAENCMKMKEFGPPGGGARPWRPPLDPPMFRPSLNIITNLLMFVKVSQTSKRVTCIQFSIVNYFCISKRGYSCTITTVFNCIMYHCHCCLFNVSKNKYGNLS